MAQERRAMGLSGRSMGGWLLLRMLRWLVMAGIDREEAEGVSAMLSHAEVGQGKKWSMISGRKRCGSA